MERREFLHHSVLLGLTGAGAAAGIGCASNAPRVPDSPVAPVDMNEYLAQLDHTMAVMRHAPILQDVRAVAHADPVGEASAFARSEELTRKSLSALTMTGAFLDLGESDRLHPGMQSRIWSSLDDFDTAVLETATLLDTMPPAERAAVQQRLEREPDLLASAWRALDDKAVLAGLPAKRRRHMQRLMGLVGGQLRREGADPLLRAYVDMVAKTRRDVSARAAQSSDSPDASSGPPPAGEAPVLYLDNINIVPDPVLVGPVRHGRRPRRSGPTMLRTGSIMLGLGVASGAASVALFVANGPVGIVLGAITATAGAIGLILGLIFMIIGAVRGSPAPSPADE